MTIFRQDSLSFIGAPSFCVTEHEGRGWEDATVIEGEEIEGGWDQMSTMMVPSTSAGMMWPGMSSSSVYRTTCPVCNKSFSRSWSLQRHMADMHYPSDRRHNCIDCGRSYRSRNSLTSHRCQYHGKPKLIYN